MNTSGGADRSEIQNDLDLGTADIVLSDQVYKDSQAIAFIRSMQVDRWQFFHELAQ